MGPLAPRSRTLRPTRAVVVECGVLELLEVVTVGAPFCGFKILTGLIALDGGPAARALGLALVVLGSLDAALNAANLGFLLASGRRAAADCSLAALAVRLGAARGLERDRLRELGDSLDLMLSFILVAAVIGAGLLPRLPGWGRAAWNVCVILNVLGAGLARLGASVNAVARGDRRRAV